VTAVLTATTPLDVPTCRRAVEASDAGYDGVFVFGVTSTGIYCRPSCPSRVPRPENTRYFTTVSRARAEGFRPCKRCHPDAAVGAEPAAEVAERALELIRQGTVEAVGVAGLATAVGYSERQLRRLFRAHFGQSPLRVAKQIGASR
jgi:AraC family transcriptional regulator of adaptative response / DNA-3-methyladenine glycosylase II